MSKILIASHDEDGRMLLARMLADQHQVELVADGWQAIEMMYEQPFDAVIADLEMPGVNGLGVVAAARAREPYLPVVVTGPGAPAPAVEAFRFGADDYVFRPLDGDIVRASVRNVLEARGVRADREKSVRDLRHANAFKAHLLRMMAHDLANMLTSVKGFGYLALRLRDVDAIHDCIRHVMGSSSFMEAVAEELSTYALIDSNELVLDPETFDLLEAVEHAVKTLCIDPRTHRVSTPKKGLHVRADKHRTTQVLLNLVGNAVKYSPNGGDIEVELMPVGRHVLCSVKDRGLGIPPDQLENIFQPLFRLDRDDVTRGTGLGLAIVRNLVEMQHGRIWAECRPDGGTVFRFTLPDASVVEQEGTSDHCTQPAAEPQKAAL